MNFRVIVLSILWVIPNFACAQADDDLSLEQIMEYIAENVSEEQDYSEITERLNFYSKHPIDINRAMEEQLKDLMFISPLQINNLIKHREESGQFQDVLELQSIEGFNNETIRWLRKFVVVTGTELLSGISFKTIIRDGDHDLLIRFGRILQKQNGFIALDSKSPVYSGSPDRIFTRYRFNYSNKISLSLNMEKDAGEAFLKSARGFDFYSASISLSGSRTLKKLVVGDYALQFGQGLALWSGLGFGKGAGFTTVAKQAVGLRPYSSVNEASFLRGMAARFVLKKISLTPFVSYKKLDATLSDNEIEINSLPISGLHRTTLERKNKNIVQQLVYGFNSNYTNGDFVTGITVYKTQLNMAMGKGNSLYEQYDFSGKSLTNLGFNYTYSFRNTYFFGEAAHSLSSGTAFLNGLMSSLTSKVSAVLLYRNYDKNYHSFFNQGISESTEATNERGVYSGLSIKFNNKFELIMYFDTFRFPWLKFRVDAPSQGHELFTQLTYSLNKKFKVSGRFKLQQKEENAGETSKAAGLETVEKQNYRVEINYIANANFSIRSRSEMSFYKKGFASKEFGFLSYQDIIYKPLSSKLSGNIRFAIFDTQGFNSRIYAYENDVLYGYSVPAYQGTGIRFYTNARYTLQRGVDIWLRYALWNYSGVEKVGSGYDVIMGNKRSDVKIQLRFQL